jgi:hypothetical protein
MILYEFPTKILNSFILSSHALHSWYIIMYFINLITFSEEIQHSQPPLTVSLLVQLSHYSVWLRAGRPGDRGSIPGRGDTTFPLASVSIPALGPTQPPVQWVPWVLSSGLKPGRGVTLTTHPHLVPRPRMSRSYTTSRTF